MNRNHGQSLLAALGVASMMLAGPAGASELDEGPVNLEYECGEGALSAHHEEDFGGTALRVLGIYEADDEEFGPVAVTVDNEEDVVLVLSAYEPVHWHVTEAHAGAIQQIVLGGDPTSLVTAPDTVPVGFLGSSSTSFDWWDPKTREVVDLAEIAAGTGLRSFHGCYSASSFTFTDGTGPLVHTGEPDCESEEEGLANGPDTSVVAASCPAVVEEAQYCLGRTVDAVVAIGLDSGDICPVVDVPVESSGGLPTSMAWYGSDLYAFEGEHGNLTRTSLEDGSQQRSFAYGTAVAGFAGELLMLPDGSDPSNIQQLWAAANLTEAHCGAHTVLPLQIMGSRLATDGGRIYAANHSTSEIEVFEPPQETPVRKIELQDFETWIMGMSVLDGEALAINATRTEGSILVFDLHDGERIREIPVDLDLGGLACMSSDVPFGDDDDDPGDDDDAADDDDDDDGGFTDFTTDPDDCSCSAAGRGPRAASVAALALLTAVAIRRRR